MHLNLLIAASLVATMGRLGTALPLTHQRPGGPSRTMVKPFDLLAKSLRCDCGFNVCALIQQRDPFGAGLQRVKVDRDRQGRVHKLVLAPLTMQGIESVDDGIRWQTILPDQNMILVQDSPTRDTAATSERLRLARRNYRFDYVGDAMIAGRRAIQIQASPTRSELTARYYALDAETLYPLKEMSGNQIEFVTLDISFPRTLGGTEFELRSEVGTRVVRFERPQSVREPAEASRMLGFRPFMPKGSPLGFEPQEIQVSQDGSWQALVVRLTDGLARATLYEYLPADKAIRAMDHSSSREINGICLMVVCPLGEEVRSALLDSLEEKRSFAELGPIHPKGTSLPVSSVRKNRASVTDIVKSVAFQTQSG